MFIVYVERIVPGIVRSLIVGCTEMLSGSVNEQ